MNKRQKAKKIAAILNELFPVPAIPLKHSSTYTLLIAVLLSAQCTDERVNKVTPALFARAETPKAMASLSLNEIESIIRPCGLTKRKASAIHQLSHLLVSRHHGHVPDSFEDLEALPGIGHKSASVIMSQAFHHPAFPVDTHIHRCAKRWGLSKGKNVKETEKDLKQIFPKKNWNLIHLQIIYFARSFCPARGHISDSCPICSWASLLHPVKDVNKN